MNLSEVQHLYPYADLFFFSLCISRKLLDALDVVFGICTHTHTQTEGEKQLLGFTDSSFQKVKKSSDASARLISPFMPLILYLPFLIGF